MILCNWIIFIKHPLLFRISYLTLLNVIFFIFLGKNGERKLIYIQKLIKFIAENMRKRENDIEKKDLERAEEAIKQSENIKEGLAFREVGEIGEKMSSGKVEEMVESVHEVSKIDKKESVERMLTEIKRRDRKKKMVRRLCGCGNTCVLYLDAMVTVGRETGGEENTHDCFNRNKSADFNYHGE